MTNKTTQEQLIELYEQQIQDLVMMSKIELGDDIIAKIKELKSQINKQQTAVEWFLENLRNLIKESELTDMRPNEFDAREMELLEQAKEMEKEQMKEKYIKGIENYDPTFKKK